MKLRLSTLLGLCFFCAMDLFAQCPLPTTVSDVTLNCSGGTGNRTGVAFNPNQNLYYSVNAGSASYPIETFSVTGGNSLSSTTQSADYRGIWWNSVTGAIEGNTFNSGGLYQHNLASGTFYAAGTVTNIASANMPNTQSMGHANVAGNVVVYYNAGTLYRYNRATGAFIASIGISGLPVATSNLNNYAVAYVGVPNGEALVYDYVNKCVYFINVTTGAYLTSCQLPTTAPAAASFQFGFANERVFLYNSSASQWYGYKVVSNSAVNPLSTPAVICAGGTAVLTNTGSATYTWVGGPTNASLAVSPSVTTSYSIIGTNTAGCTASAVITVSVNNTLPTLTITPSATTACLGQTVVLTASGANSYTWNNNVINATAFSPSTTSNYIVNGQNACGTTTASISIPVAPLPVQVASAASVVCAGNAAQLTATAVATTYTWLPGNLSGSVVSIAPTTATSYTVIASNGQCLGTATIAMAVNPVPTIAIAASGTNICAGESSTISASGATSYTWQVGGNGTSIVVTPTNNTLYSVSGTNSLGCVASANIPVITKPLPTLGVSATQTLLCTGSSATLNATGTGTAYSWSSGGTGASEVVSPLSNQTYTCITTAANACTAMVIIPIGVFSPTVSITGNTAVCVGKSTTLVASGADSYDWLGYGPFQSITVSPSIPTTFTLSATTVSDNVTCSKDFFVNVTINPLPTPTIAATRTVMCTKESITFTASGATSYVWNNTTTMSTNSFTSNVAGNYAVSVVATDVNGCVGSSTVNIRVNSCNSIEEQTSTAVKVYPVPSNGVITVVVEQDMDVNLIDNAGRLIRTCQLNASNDRTMHVQGLSAGVYFLTSPSLEQSRKIVVIE